jgi:dienelactone hydrolase
MQLHNSTAPDGVVQHHFSVDDVPGVLWSPEPGDEPGPLVLMGHPGGLHKEALGLVGRALALVRTFGWHVAAIDAPGHGDRARSADDEAWVAAMQRARAAGEPLGAIVSEFNGSIAERAVPEWRAVLDELLRLPRIDAGRPVGYTGMTLATEIGLRLVAADDRIGAAVVGAAFASEALVRVANSVEAPVQYLLPWDDAEIDRESGLALFDALGSAEKSLHVFPGPHQRVPAAEVADSNRFLERHLAG